MDAIKAANGHARIGLIFFVPGVNETVFHKVSETINQIVAATVGNEQRPTVIRNRHEPRPIALRAYRVNGRARVSTDADLRRRFAVNGKEPATVMVVTVEQAFPHCPKALVRSDLWKAASGARPQGVPTLGDFVAARDPGINSAAFDAAYNQRIPNELY